MIELAYIARPLIGAVIGYITNDIAIRMLFRPRTAKYLFGVKIPFTPGLIPKEKSRIAASIGDAISKNLMNKETLEKTLLSQEMLDKIRGEVICFFDKQKHNQETLHQFLSHFLTGEEVANMILNIKTKLASLVSVKLENSYFGIQIADIVVEHVMSRLRINGLDIPIGVFGFGALLGSQIWGRLAEMLTTPLKNFLARNIDQMMYDHGGEFVNNLLDSQFEDLSSMQMCQLLKGHEPQIEQVCNTVVSLYKKLISEQLPKILATINISKIIENRINEMDVKESEKLILKVMNRELKAIVWLGALLGFLMGCVNLLF